MANVASSCAKVMHESGVCHDHIRICESIDGRADLGSPAALRAAGCAKVFSEKASGAKTDRAELRKAVARLGEGDVLMVTRLGRLARSTQDLLNTLDEIAPASSPSPMHGRIRQRRMAG
jgi:hypothetical protein